MRFLIAALSSKINHGGSKDTEWSFSYSRSQRDTVINYIMTQGEHHRIKKFKEEYIKMLSEFEVEYDSKYLFEFYE
jgi:hypothetical protein